MTKPLVTLPEPGKAHRDWNLQCCDEAAFKRWWAVAIDTGNVMSKETFCRDAIDPETREAPWCLLKAALGKCTHAGGPPQIIPYAREDDVVGYRHRRLSRHPGGRVATGA